MSFVSLSQSKAIEERSFSYSDCSISFLAFLILFFVNLGTACTAYSTSVSS